MLVAVKGEDVDKFMLALAFKLRPCLLIDCGNAADPYSIQIEEEWLDEVYVINAEAIYRFRDALKKIPQILNELNLKILVITSISILFSYDDKLEDKHIITDCWKLLKNLSKDFDIYAVADEYSKEFTDKTWDTLLQANA